jgi:hypothetical protein
MAAKERHRASSNSKIIATVTAVVMIAFIAFVLVFAAQTAQPDLSSSGRVGPKLAVDQDKFDFGRVVYDKPVRAVFTLRNVGDQPLRIADRQIATRVVEGC